MVFLHQFEQSKNKTLTTLASTSFGIYFIHGYVLQLLILTKYKLEITMTYPWITYFIIWGILIILSIVFVKLLKKMFPKYSKYITGY